jgi:hypothetical protein
VGFGGLCGRHALALHPQITSKPWSMRVSIDNDGKHAPESRSGRVQLAVGVHRIKCGMRRQRIAWRSSSSCALGPVEPFFRTQM